MNSQEKYEHWLNIAQEDLHVTNTLFNNQHYLYVTFMCQQAIEKLVKGLYIISLDDNFPRIHEIQKIVKALESKLTVLINME
jgi:HEPN domain-containing protein